MSNYPDDFRGVLPGEQDDPSDDDLAAALDEAFGVAERAGDALADIGKSLIRIERANNYGQSDAGHEGDVRAIAAKLEDVAALLTVLARDARSAVR